MKEYITEDHKIDMEWDDFLRNQPNGHHVQSSAWGMFKATSGMKVIRIKIKEADEVVGGAQILVRSIPIFGGIGYISKGPVAGVDRTDVLDFLFDVIEKTARRNRLLVLSVELPVDDPEYMSQLEKRRYFPSDFYIIPPTTVLVDLEEDDKEILSQMKSRTRRNIRKGLKSDLVIREGRDSDIPVVFSWMEEAGERSSYYYYDLEYYQKAIDILGGADILKLFVAEFEGQPVSAIYVAAFGDWAVFKWGASSGDDYDKRPNELLHWHAIQWSKSRGCTHYDLGGITPVVAKSLNRGEELPDIKESGIAHFKLGFGRLNNFPKAFDNNYSPLPRWFIRAVIKNIWNNESLRAITRRILNPGS